MGSPTRPASIVPDDPVGGDPLGGDPAAGGVACCGTGDPRGGAGLGSASRTDPPTRAARFARPTLAGLMAGPTPARPGRRRLEVATACLGLVALALAVAPAASVAMTSALFTGSDASALSVTTATLDPPSALAAGAGGLTVTLTWAVSPDAAVATGYQVHRGTATGGPYGQVGSVTPATATTTADVLSTGGTYFYVLRTFAGGAPWTSGDSNEASVSAATSVDTGWKACGSNAAVTTGAGDNDGYEGTPAEACDDDSVFATDINSGTNASSACTNAGKDRHTFWTFGLGVPLTATSVGGIEVRGDWRTESASNNPTLCARLSYDGGTSWTAFVSLGVILTTTEATYTFGSTADTWGRTWAAAELSDATFRVQIVDVAQNTGRDFSLDGLRVRVTYTP